MSDESGVTLNRTNAVGWRPVPAPPEREDADNGHALSREDHRGARQARGKPCIRGTRMTVYDVLSYLAASMTRDEILADFPYLTDEDILASLSYAADREKRMLVR